MEVNKLSAYYTEKTYTEAELAYYKKAGITFSKTTKHLNKGALLKDLEKGKLKGEDVFGEMLDFMTQEALHETLDELIEMLGIHGGSTEAENLINLLETYLGG